jgi:lysozyme
MQYRSIEEQLMEHEGFRPTVYKCSAGKLTIGFGRNLESNGITMAEARILLRNDIYTAERDCRSIFPDWENFSKSRQWALIDMRFNLGPQGLRSFVRMISAISHGNWDLAAKEAVDSTWYHQVGRRSRHIVEQLKNESSSRENSK